MIIAREIKFRGKDILSGDWRYGYAQFNYDKTRAQIISPLRIDISAFPGQFFHVDKETVGQFTGLLDKIGKEIYEGDILRVNEYKNEAIPLFKYDDIQQLSLDDVKGKKTKEWIGEVEFEESAFFIKDTYLSAFHGDMRLSSPIYEIEVIGNKFDNPELLEESI